MAEGLKKGQWSKSEDELLTHGVQRYGNQWTKVATCVSSRSADQCAKRWQQSLDPRLDRSEWRGDEDAALLKAVESLGRHWKDIQERYLPQRSKNCVKNRYSVLTRRSTNRLAPYDDSIESSSSDPGTPLQVEGDVTLDFMPTPFIAGVSQPYQGQMPHVSSAEMSWPWSGISNPSVTLPADFDAFDCTMWPVYSEASLSQTIPNTQGQWNDMESGMGLQQPVQHFNTSNPHVHAYTHPTYHQSLVSSSSPYTSSEPSSAYAYAPALRTSHPSTHRRLYGQCYTHR